MERKLVTIRTISDIQQIEGADAIEAVHIDGWTVVAQKGQGHQVGSPVLYFEIDSFLPFTDPRFVFLEQRGSKTARDGTRGHVLRTIKLRGTYSQGMILPLSEFPEAAGMPVGSDVTELLGVTKWEPPVPAQLAGVAKGNFPGWIRKTDAERVQNLVDIFPLEGQWVATEKIDGTSATYAIDEHGEFVVCSRNLQLKPSDAVYWKIAEKFDIENLLRSIAMGGTIVLQGEIFGEGIQKNPLGIKGVDFRAFNLDVHGYGQNTLAGDRRQLVIDEFSEWKTPVKLADIYTLNIPSSVDEAVEQVDGLKSLISPDRQAEGIVWWKNPGGSFNHFKGEFRNFKVINNRFLAKQKD